MLLQTILQLNILILATPALAGWPLLPPAHFDMARAGIVRQFRVAETATLKSAVKTQQRHVTRLSAAAVSAPAPILARFPVDAPDTAFVSFSTLPHAARAP